ncbi:carbohydrate-binding protein [Kitasatospora sp. NPDC004240]
MTTGSNGVPESPEGGAPQDDDPFGYLYRPADGAPAQSGDPQQGVPRTSYSRPMEVGRAQYGQQPRVQQPYPPYGQQPQQQPYPAQQPGYPGEAPTTQTRYAERSRPRPGDERPGGGRSKGAVIGAVAVIAAVAIGAGIALSTGGGDDDKKAKGGASTTAAVTPSSSGASPSAGSSASSTATASAQGVTDASQLQGQNAPSGNSVKGAKSADGSYLTLQPGGSVTWTGEVPAAGTYKFSLHFSNPGGSLRASVAVNGKDREGGIEFKNYAPGNDAANSWYNTYILPQLQSGSNTVTIAVPAGGGGSVLVDQITVTPN